MSRDAEGQLIVPNKTNLKVLKVRVLKEACEELKLLPIPPTGNKQRFMKADYIEALLTHKNTTSTAT